MRKSCVNCSNKHGSDCILKTESPTWWTECLGDGPDNKYILWKPPYSITGMKDFISEEEMSL